MAECKMCDKKVGFFSKFYIYNDNRGSLCICKECYDKFTNCSLCDKKLEGFKTKCIYKDNKGNEVICCINCMKEHINKENEKQLKKEEKEHEQQEKEEKEQQLKKEKEKNQVKEYKRKCNECGKVWHSLASKEEEILKNRKLSRQGQIVGAFGGNLGLAAQSQRNADAQDELLDKLKKCPQCGSHNYTETINFFDKKESV